MINSKPKVSVIIPVYNSEASLTQCLESVIDQSYDNYDVIVVDNNSQDVSNDIIMGFADKNLKIKCVFEPNRSRGAARNRGIKEAHGDIIIMTDSDCIVPGDWIEKMIYPIVNENESIVMGGDKDIIGNFWTQNIQESNRVFFQNNSEGKYIKVLDSKSFAIKADIMRSLMFNENIHNLEDFEFSLRIRDKIKIRFLSNIQVAHYHKSSLKGWLKLNFNRGFWAARIYFLHKEKEYVKTEPMFQSLKLCNFLIWPFWFVYQIIKKPYKKIWFIFISEVAWRSGLLYAMIIK
ncbi:glycosyltransferase family 2 protein [Spirochaetota bacterium]